MSTEHIAFFGRRGVGTTTVVTNLAAALAEAGQRVVLVGCGARGDTTARLRPNKALRPLFLASGLAPTAPPDAVGIGFKGVLCLEAGTPDSLDIATLPDLIEQATSALGPLPEVVLYDLSGEVAMLRPLIAAGVFQTLVAVSSAEVDALYTVNQLFRLVHEAGEGRIQLAGVVGNDLSALCAETVLDDFARKTASTVLSEIPRSLVVTRSAYFGETVIDAAPLSHQAYYYRKLARRIRDRLTALPTPLDTEAFNDWALEWGDRLYDYGEGLVSDGAAI